MLATNVHKNMSVETKKNINFVFRYNIAVKTSKESIKRRISTSALFLKILRHAISPTQGADPLALKVGNN